MWFNLAEGVLALPSLELTCFGEAPLAAGAQSCFFLILPVVTLKMAWLVTGKASSCLHFLGPHGTGHFHLEDRIVGQSLLQVVRNEQPLIIFLR